MDLAAAALRGVEPVGHIGVWPEFSLLNHSCSPNTIHWVLGDTMVVRCATPIKSGDEVTISYLGRPQLAPVAQRVAALKEEYGFDCDCPRFVRHTVPYDVRHNDDVRQAAARHTNTAPAVRSACKLTLTRTFTHSHAHAHGILHTLSPMYCTSHKLLLSYCISSCDQVPVGGAPRRQGRQPGGGAG